MVCKCKSPIGNLVGIPKNPVFSSVTINTTDPLGGLVAGNMFVGNDASGTLGLLANNAVKASVNSYTILVTNAGEPFFNAAAGKALHFRINGGEVGQFSPGGDLVLNNSISITAFLSMPMSTEKTISGGVVTATASFFPVDTEADAATDDLDTISGGIDGRIIILKSSDNARTVVVKHGTGNLILNGAADFSMSNTSYRIQLQYDSALTKWVEISRSA
jgi:hypothetical protein